MIHTIGAISMFIMFAGLTRENLTFKYLLSSYQVLLFYGRCKRKQISIYVWWLQPLYLYPWTCLQRREEADIENMDTAGEEAARRNWESSSDIYTLFKKYTYFIMCKTSKQQAALWHGEPAWHCMVTERDGMVGGGRLQREGLYI